MSPTRLYGRQFVLFFGDCLALFAAFALGFFINTLGQGSITTFSEHLGAYIGLFVLWFAIYYGADLYTLAYAKPTLPFVRRLGIVAIAEAITGVFYFYVFSFTTLSPKSDLAVIIIVSIGLLYLWRRIFFSLFSKKFQEQVIIVGRNAFSEELSDAIRGNPQYGLREPFIVATATESLLLLKDHPEISTIIIATANKETNNTLIYWYRQGLSVMDIAQAYETFLYKIPVDFIDETWILHKLEKRSTIISMFFQEIIGRIIALVVVTLMSPLLIMVAIALKIQDRGPIFIRQSRVGKFGKTFRLYKFRSMVALDKDGQAENGTAVWAGEDDPRITRVGKIIRKTHIDEIAQMLNVLRGDLALVGPRPERPEFVEKLEGLIPHYSLRHIIKPGFTGWAQVKYRYARTVDDSRDKFQFDLYYLKNKNIFLDMGIVMKTLQIMFTH